MKKHSTPLTALALVIAVAGFASAARVPNTNSDTVTVSAKVDDYGEFRTAKGVSHPSDITGDNAVANLGKLDGSAKGSVAGKYFFYFTSNFSAKLTYTMTKPLTLVPAVPSASAVAAVAQPNLETGVWLYGYDLSGNPYNINEVHWAWRDQAFTYGRQSNSTTNTIGERAYYLYFEGSVQDVADQPSGQYIGTVTMTCETASSN
jgi:hypothetical protein